MSSDLQATIDHLYRDNEAWRASGRVSNQVRERLTDAANRARRNGRSVYVYIPGADESVGIGSGVTLFFRDCHPGTTAVRIDPDGLAALV